MLHSETNELENPLTKYKHLLVFDGVCNLCNFWVKWVLKKEKKENIYFTSLQSEFGKKVLEHLSQTNIEVPDSILFIENGKLYHKSRAVLKLANKLKVPWETLGFILNSTKLYRLYDAVYELIASNRYKVFGKRDYCPVPEKEVLHRFIE